MKQKEQHTSCEGCRYASESCASEIVKESNEKAYLKCWKAQPTKFERIFSKVAIIVSWVLAIPFYYELYLLIFGR